MVEYWNSIFCLDKVRTRWLADTDTDKLMTYLSLFSIKN